jgi:hypothetical protein
MEEDRVWLERRRGSQPTSTEIQKIHRPYDKLRRVARGCSKVLQQARYEWRVFHPRKQGMEFSGSSDRKKEEKVEDSRRFIAVLRPRSSELVFSVMCHVVHSSSTVQTAPRLLIGEARVQGVS